MPQPSPQTLPPENSPMRLGDMIDRLHELRELRRALSKQDDTLKEEFSALEQAVIARLGDDGTIRAEGSSASVSISETDVATVTEWDDLYPYIRDNDAFYLLQRRVNNAAYQELAKAGVEVPGVTTFTKKSLNLRTTTR